VKALKEETLLRDPEATWRDIVWAWNRCREEVPGWPQVAFAFTSRRNTYSLPWASFPPSLKADVDGYLNRLAGSDLTEDLPFRPVRPATRHLRERQLRTFASAVVHRGSDPATIRGLADLVALDAYQEGLRFFLERRDGKSSAGILELACSLKSVAKYWVKVDTATLDSMSKIVRRLSVKHRGMTAKNRDRLRPLEDPEIRYALVNLPPKLMRMAESGKLRPRRAALLAQTAVALEILLMAPIRIRNLINLDLDRHLVRPARIRGALHIVIPGEEVKNSAELDYPLPEESSALIARYIEHHRPVIASGDNRALFPGPGGGAKSEHTLAGQITKTVFRFVGIKVHVHLFRHVAAKLHLDQHPGEYAVVARALGNRSIDVTAAHYTGLETTAAVRHFDKTILSLRHRSPRP
jgi:integrase